MSLAGRGEDNPETSETQRWEAMLWAARNSWDVNRRRLPQDAEGWLAGGGWAARRLDKIDADKFLRAAFAALNRECAR